MEGIVTISIEQYEEYKALMDNADENKVLVQGNSCGYSYFYVLPKDEIVKKITKELEKARKESSDISAKLKVALIEIKSLKYYIDNYINESIFDKLKFWK